MVAPIFPFDWSIFPVYRAICLLACISWCPWGTGITSPSLTAAAAAAPTSGLAAPVEGEGLGVGLPSAQPRSVEKSYLQEGETGKLHHVPTMMHILGCDVRYYSRARGTPNIKGKMGRARSFGVAASPLNSVLKDRFSAHD